MSHDAPGDNIPDLTSARHASRAAAPVDGDILSSVKCNLARFNSSLELFCRKLGHVLPDINREINNTYHQASLTMDSLISEAPAGLIEITVSALDVSLARIDKHLRDQKAGDAQFVKDLEALWAALPAVQASVADFQTISAELAAAHPMPQETSGTARSDRHAQGLIALAHAMAANASELAVRQSRLERNMQATAALHSDITSTVEIHTAQVGNALKDTLNSVVAILKDLIARSNATKGPIRAIMTALQIHDIIRQDIVNILMVIDRLRAMAEDADHPEHAAFRRHASATASLLLGDVSTIVHDHVQIIERYIQAIHSIISGVKDDKIHLAELLLINPQGQSTLDRALQEITAMFQDLGEGLNMLAKLGQERTQTLNEVLDLLDGLNHDGLAAFREAQVLADALGGYALDLPEALNECAFNMQAALSALAKPIAQPDPSAAHLSDAAQECIILIQEDTETLRDSLMKIKHVLFGSIDGINVYASRCLLAVLRFKHRMERLNLFLVRLPDIADALKNSAGISGAPPQDAVIHDPQLQSILSTLHHPHIKTLKRPEDPPQNLLPDDGDLTLF